MSSIITVAVFGLLVSLSVGQVRTTNITLDTRCGVTIGCFSDPHLSFVVSWTVLGGDGIYTIKATLPDNFYVALGFSSDTRMGGDKVIGCAVTSTTVASFSAINQGHDAAPIQSEVVALSNSKYEDGIIECTLTVNSSLQEWVNITKPSFLLLARGGAKFTSGAVSGIQEHHGGENKASSNQPVSVSSNVSVFPAKGPERMVQAHACLMILAWVLSASVGILIARYYKPVWEGTLFSQKIWFQIHRGCMLLVLACTTVGFILIWAHAGGWSDIESEHVYLKAHPILGIIVMSLTVLNPLMALIRPPPGTSKRSIFNWAHLLMGEGGHILAVLNTFFGLALYDDSPASLTYIMYGYVAFSVLAGIALTSIKYCFKEDTELEYFSMNDSDHMTCSPGKELPRVILVKKAILVSYVLVVAVISALLIGLLVQGK